MRSASPACSLTLAIGLSAMAMPASAADAVGATRIAHWKDDRAAALVLMFDDSCQSDVKNAIPELTKRGFTGTFYINPGSGHFAAQKSAWEKDIPAAGFELANHTMTHKGVKSVAEAEAEIGGCTEAIHQLTPKLPWLRLVSWGQPGVPAEAWTLSKSDLDAQLAKNHLVSRPDFGDHGAMITLKTADDMLKRVDKAIATHIFECIVFHGVGEDWIITPMPIFIEFLDGLAKRSDQVWITNHIPVHQYATERDAATVKPGASSAAKITVTLSCTADPVFYDLPLTLVTTVPESWKACVITQGKRHAQATVTMGTVRYDALPGSDLIVIEPDSTAKKK